MPQPSQHAFSLALRMESAAGNKRLASRKKGKISRIKLLVAKHKRDATESGTLVVIADFAMNGKKFVQIR
jgi:hypothetical protein